MTTYDNREPLDGWQVTPAIHCGQLCVDRTCPVCLEWLPMPPGVILGSE
jgi:hypothetical protein